MKIIQGISFPFLIVLCIGIGAFIFYIINDNDESIAPDPELYTWIVIFAIILAITFVAGIFCIINIYKRK